MMRDAAPADVGARRARPHPQAGDRRGHRLRARRRLRARADRRLPGQRRQRQVGPARDPARHHPRRRRHAAAAAADRPGQGQGPDLHRPVRRRRTRRSRSGWSTWSCRPPRCTRPRWRWRRSSPRARRWRWRAAKAAIDGGLDGDLATGLRLESHLFASLFATEDRTIGMASFLENGPGKAEFVGSGRVTRGAEPARHAPKRSRRPGPTRSWPTSSTTTGRPAPTTRSGRSRFDQRCIDYARDRFAHVAGTAGWPYAPSLELGCGTGFFTLNLKLAGVLDEGHVTDLSPGMVEVAQRNAARARLRGRGTRRRRRAAALRRRQLRPGHRARGAAPHPRRRAGASRGAAGAQAGRPVRLRRRADPVRRLRGPPAVAADLVGRHPGDPAAAAGRTGAGRRRSSTSRPAPRRSRRSSTCTPSSRPSCAALAPARRRGRRARRDRRSCSRPGSAGRCAPSSARCRARSSACGWANFALQGWQRLLGGRRACSSGVVPRGLFYNAEITGLKPARDAADRGRAASISTARCRTPRRASSPRCGHAFAVNGVAAAGSRDTERALLGPPFYDSLPPLIGGGTGCRA